MIRAMAESDIKYGLRSVLAKIEQARLKRPQVSKTSYIKIMNYVKLCNIYFCIKIINYLQELQCIEPILVAVSKTKPANAVIEAYEAGQRHFGENYVQELIDKGNNADILDKCKEIKWHYIGHLQRNKINKVLATPNLYLIETVDTDKLASALHNAWPKFGPANSKLKIMIQVNTSAEDGTS